MPAMDDVRRPRHINPAVFDDDARVVFLLVSRLPYRIGEHQASSKGADVETLAERARAIPLGSLPLR